MISTDERYTKSTATVNGKKMAYVETGQGDPIVFLHGNPTSSYLWRNIIPYLEGQARCIAPDLIGMGDSEKLDDPGPDSYRFVEHRRYLHTLLDQLGVGKDATFVIHDWGSALGFDWINSNPGKAKGVAYMEAIVQTLTWEDWPPPVKPVFQGFRSPAGDEMILQGNVFVEQVLPGAVLRGLTDEEMAVYRRPFTAPGESRRPTLTWPRQLPIEGEPADVTKIVEEYGACMAQAADLPKLFINADPGAILRGKAREFCRSWPNQQEITVKGSHFIQEDSPDEIGAAISAWYNKLG